MSDAPRSNRPAPRTAAAVEAELRRRIRLELEQARGELDGQLDDAALAAIIARAVSSAMQWHLEAPEHTRNATLSSRSWRPAGGPRGGRPAEDDERPARDSNGPRPPRDFDRGPRDLAGHPAPTTARHVIAGRVMTAGHRAISIAGRVTSTGRRATSIADRVTSTGRRATSTDLRVTSSVTLRATSTATGPGRRVRAAGRLTEAAASSRAASSRRLQARRLQARWLQVRWLQAPRRIQKPPSASQITQLPGEGGEPLSSAATANTTMPSVSSMPIPVLSPPT